MLQETRQRGYSMRNPVVRPVSNTLAVPIFENGHVAASLGLTWFSSALSAKDAQKTLYPVLRTASEKIGLRLAALAQAGAKPAGVTAPLRKKASRKKAL
jgi:IclR family mhp operon transcriptional activator